MNPRFFQETKGSLILPNDAKVIYLPNPSGKLLCKNIRHKMVTEDIFQLPPTMKDIQQGIFGDCFLLAALIAIFSLPEGETIIRNMMKDEGDRVIVKLFDHARKPYFISIDKSIPDITLIANHIALWVKLIEKAYAAFDHGRCHGTYSVLDAGQTEDAMEILAGVTKEQSYSLGKKFTSDQSETYTPQELEVFSRIKLAIENNKPLTVSNNFYENTPKGIIPLHSYAVIDVEDNACTQHKYVIVKNPYSQERHFISRMFLKGGRASVDVPNHEAQSGWSIRVKSTRQTTFRMELRDFCQAFSHVDVFHENRGKMPSNHF